MSKFADVALIPTVGPDQVLRSLKLGVEPAGICKRYRPGSTEWNWYIATHGKFRHGDAMVTIWYDGITCFIKANTGYTVAVNDELNRLKRKINISDGDSIQINDCWDEKKRNILLQVTISYGKEKMLDSVETKMKFRPVVQKQILTSQPTAWSSNVSYQRPVFTQQKRELENSTLMRIHPNTENKLLKSNNHDNPKARGVAEKINTFENIVPASQDTHNNPKLYAGVNDNGSRKRNNQSLLLLGSKKQNQGSPKTGEVNPTVDHITTKQIYPDLRDHNNTKEPDKINFNRIYEEVNPTVGHIATKQIYPDLRDHNNRYTKEPDKINFNNIYEGGGTTYNIGCPSSSANCEEATGHGSTSHPAYLEHEISQPGIEKTAFEGCLMPSANYQETTDHDTTINPSYLEQNINQQVENQTVSLYEKETVQLPTNFDWRNTTYSFDMDYNTNQGTQMKGVSNMGMTCYANGVFQILAQTKQFLKTLMKLDTQDKPLTLSLWKVLEEINTPSHQKKYFTVNRAVVNNFLELIAEDSSFSRYRQDDCSEFLLYILERLKAENDISTSMFEMNLQTVFEHEAVPYPHIDICDSQLSFHLLVPMVPGRYGKRPTVASGLNKMLNVVENVSVKELPCRFCDSTKPSRNRTIAKLFVVSKAPEILILQIGRVENSMFRGYSNLRKKNVLVEYDHSLSIDEVHWEDYRRKNIHYSYQLYGVVLHSGSIHSGHYYCYVKNQYSSDWYYCNDSRVCPIDQTMVLNDADAYLLFYEKTSRE